MPDFDVRAGLRTGNVLLGGGVNAEGSIRRATGSFSAVAGASVAAGALIVGWEAARHTATATISGAKTLVNLGGVNGRLLIGNPGNGTLTVSGGAVLGATLNASACSAPGAWCGNGIGGAAGSTGSLMLTGAASEVRLLYASIASVRADTGFGTPGGNSNGTVNNLAGGVLRTEGAALGTGAGGPLALGTEKSFANVLIDGVGSKWIVTPSSVDGGIAFMGIATHANATANVTHWMSATARSSSPASQARRARCGWTPARW